MAVIEVSSEVVPADGEWFLYHCSGCGKDLLEDSEDYDSCPACSSEKYEMVRALKPLEVVKGQFAEDAIEDEEEDEETPVPPSDVVSS